ncbi:hypothetical protein [Myxococcus landrumensis]|uniref:hypothetical protein n=1 Tax=Myxococcus landrumensis TaxID=2813577 RepID=UPI001F509CE7|nr:hypothetical protein [Myxococcus landrumus]
MQEANEAWPQHYDSSRYHGINLNSLFFLGTKATASSARWLETVSVAQGLDGACCFSH